jgi:hypothetical protein
MVVAVVCVRIVEMPRDEKIDVVTVRHAFVAAARVVLVVARVAGTVVAAVARGGILGARRDRVFVDMTFVRMVQMPIVHVVGVAFVPDTRVPAALSVRVLVMS